MSSFKFGPVAGTPEHWYTPAALGVAAASKLTSLDQGKAVKLIADSNYGLCAAADEIEGVLVSLEPVTMNNGFGFGTVQTHGRMVAQAKGGVLAIGALVVAAAQPAVGTAITPIPSGTQTTALPLAVQAGAPTTFKWRVIAHFDGGAGAVNTFLLIERI